MSTHRRRLLSVAIVLAVAAVVVGIWAAVASSRCGTSQTWSVTRGCHPGASAYGS